MRDVDQNPGRHYSGHYELTQLQTKLPDARIV